MVQATSLAVYYEKVLPNLSQKQGDVYRYFLVHYPEAYTNMELAQGLGWSINRVTPRVLELRNEDLLELAKRRLCRVTHNMAMSWRVADYRISSLLVGIKDWRKWRLHLAFRHNELAIIDYIPRPLWHAINERLLSNGFTYDYQNRTWEKW